MQLTADAILKWTSVEGTVLYCSKINETFLGKDPEFPIDYRVNLTWNADRNNAVIRTVNEWMTVINNLPSVGHPYIEVIEV